MYDQEKKKSRGFGFLSFEDEIARERAVAEHFVSIQNKQVQTRTKVYIRSQIRYLFRNLLTLFNWTEKSMSLACSKKNLSLSTHSIVSIESVDYVQK